MGKIFSSSFYDFPYLFNNLNYRSARAFSYLDPNSSAPVNSRITSRILESSLKSNNVSKCDYSLRGGFDRNRKNIPPSFNNTRYLD